MNDLFTKIEKVKNWTQIPRDKNSQVDIALSSGKLVFFTANTETSGRYSSILDLTLIPEEKIYPEMEKHFMHISEIAKRFKKKE